MFLTCWRLEALETTITLNEELYGAVTESLVPLPDHSFGRIQLGNIKRFCTLPDRFQLGQFDDPSLSAGAPTS